MGKVLGDTGLLMLVVIAMVAVILVIIDHQSVKLVVANPRNDGMFKIFKTKNYAAHLALMEASKTFCLLIMNKFQFQVPRASVLVEANTESVGTF